ncbi:MAG: ATP-dependent helicase [Minisyncoccota bacterium]
MDHLQGLNQEQKKAVLHTKGPLMILAGAGTGKTKTITHRILHLIKEGVAPEEILAITFTNKAAREMEDRVGALLGSDAAHRYSGAPRPFVSTFHRLGVHILRNEGHRIGLSKHFTIFDKADATRAIKEAVIARGLDPKQFEPGRIGNTISRQKGDFVTLDEYRAAAGNEYFPRIVADVWTLYEELLKKEGAVDFDDLLLKTALLLRDNEDVRTHYQATWQYLHVDEYQDTNSVQYAIARLLAQAHRNICVVGDTDQNIYSWRGANLQNIMNFETDYPDANIVILEENYRSTQTILAAANDAIRKNKIRKEKTLFTKNIEGEKISLYGAYDEADEATYIARVCGELMARGAVPEDIAVLYRANFQSRALEEAFLGKKIPYQVLGVRFFERKEVRDIIGFLRAALNPHSLSDVKRIVNVPPRGIGKVTLAKMFSENERGLTASAAKSVSSFRSLLASIAEVALRDPVSHTIKYILRESGIEAHLRSGTEEDRERLENIRELVTLATKYDTLPPEEGVAHLIADAALATDQDSLEKNERAVKLMTVHAAKGLEFPYVFITGLEQDLFPHRRIGAGGVSHEEEEEERRLFYVALTRAEKKLFLTYASIRTIFGSRQINTPSEFLSDLDSSYVEEVLEPIGQGEFGGKVIYLD